MQRIFLFWYIIQMNNFLLYTSTVLIWGTTWLAIKFQLGTVDPMVSVFYRFLLSAIILIPFCRILGLKMRFSLKEHMYMAVQGLFLFAINYWLFYLAEVYITSGLAAVVFSMPVARCLSTAVATPITWPTEMQAAAAGFSIHPAELL